MKLQPYLESAADILGLESVGGSRQQAQDLFSSSISRAAPLYRSFRLSDDRRQLPLVVISEASDTEDLFATVATYYAAQSPLTAQVHVLSSEIRQCFDSLDSSVTPDSSLLSRRQLALLGACLGETTLVALGSNEGQALPSYSACRRSLGFTVARALALYPTFDISTAIDRWSRLRQLTGLSVSSASVSTIRLLLSALNATSQDTKVKPLPPALREALVSYLTNDQPDVVMEDAILEVYPGVRDVYRQLDGPFDARMSAFLSSVEGIQSYGQGADADSLAVAFVCNKILSGSFSHTRVLLRLVDFFPSALVWYGVFSTTSTGFEIRSFGNGLLAKLWRDLNQSFSFEQRPQCDISLDELEVLMRAPIKSEAIKPSQQKIALVGLLPGLDVYSRFSNDESSISSVDSPQNQHSIDDEKLRRATQLMAEATALLVQIAPTERPRLPAGSGSKRQRKR